MLDIVNRSTSKAILWQKCGSHLQGQIQDSFAAKQFTPTIMAIQGSIEYGIEIVF